MPKVPRMRKTMFAEPMFMNRETGRFRRHPVPFPEDWDRIYKTSVPVQGPDLPYELEERRQLIRDAQEAYENAVANEMARQAYNRERMAQAVEMRKRELWREYMEAEDPPPGIGWPTGKAEHLDEEFENEANWDVRGMVDPSTGWAAPTTEEFREEFKDVPWRTW